MLNSSQWVKKTDTFSLKKMYFSYSRIPRMKLLAVVVKSRKPTPSTTWTPIRLSASTSRLTHSAKGRRCGLSQWWLAEAALRWSWMKSKHPVSPILKDQRGVAYHSVGYRATDILNFATSLPRTSTPPATRECGEVLSGMSFTRRGAALPHL